MTKVTPFLMFNDHLEASMECYTATFPDSRITNVACTGKDGPVASAEFVVRGQVFMGNNGGPYFTFSEGFSLYVDCDVQAEVEESWEKLVKAGAKHDSVRLDQGSVSHLLADDDGQARSCGP